MDAVVDRHDQLSRDEKRAIVVWDVNHIRLLLSQRGRKNQMIAQRPGSFSLINLFEIARKWTEFVKVPIGADEQVFVLWIDQREIPDKIPDIGSYTELVNLPNVDCDAHARGAVIIMNSC